MLNIPLFTEGPRMVEINVYMSSDGGLLGERFAGDMDS